MTQRRREVVRLLTVYGPLTENAISSKMSTRTKGVSIVLQQMKKAGLIQKSGQRWALIGGPKEPTKLLIDERRSRINDIRTAEYEGASTW